MTCFIYLYVFNIYLYITKVHLYFFPIKNKYKLYNNIYLYKIYINKRDKFKIYCNGYCYYTIDNNNNNNNKINYNELTLAYTPDTIESIYIKFNKNNELILDDIIKHKILYDILTHSSYHCNITHLIYYYLKYELKIKKIDIEDIKIKFNNKYYQIDLNKSINENYKDIEKVLP